MSELWIVHVIARNSEAVWLFDKEGLLGDFGLDGLPEPLTDAAKDVLEDDLCREGEHVARVIRVTVDNAREAHMLPLGEELVSRKF